MTESLDLAVLGPLRGHRGGVPLKLGPPQQRAVLAALLATGGAPVPIDVITEVLWGQNPPAAATGVVQHYLSSLRRALAPGTRKLAVIQRSAGGYRLVVEDGATDVVRFRLLVEQGHRHLADADLGAAITDLMVAQALWRGAVAEDLDPRIRGHRMFRALEQEREAAVELLADVALRDGSPDVLMAVGDRLEEAVSRDPLSESLAARLIRVRSAGGEVAAALKVYERTRSLLREELGLEPGAEMEAARQRIPAPGTTANQAVLPALPSPPATFVGRDDLRRRLSELTGGSATAVPVIVVTGMPGVGKTSLVLHWTREEAAAYPDGQLYVDLHGFTPGAEPLEPGEVLRGFLTALGANSHQIPHELDEKVALFRSFLSRRRLLLILDNARDGEQVRSLLPGSPGSAVVITSRGALLDLVAEGAQPIAPDVFTVQEAERYLSARLGDGPLQREPQARDVIIQVCQGLPLALAVVAARVAGRGPEARLAAVGEELRREAGLDGFTQPEGGVDVRGTFTWSYRQLSAPAATLFRHLAHYPGREVSLAIAADIETVNRSAARRSLRQLTDAHLLIESAPGRYRFHDLLRAFAGELAQKHDAPGERALIVGRILDHFQRVATEAGALLMPGRKAPEDPGFTGPSPVVLTSPEAAVAWFQSEYPDLVTALDLALGTGAEQPGLQLLFGLVPYQVSISLRYHDLIGSISRALPIAEENGKLAWTGYLHWMLARCYISLGHSVQARYHLGQTTIAGRAAGDALSVISSLLGTAELILGSFRTPDPRKAAEIRPYLVEGMELARSLDEDTAQLYKTNCMMLLAWSSFYEPGGYPVAVRQLTEAVDFLQQIKFQFAEALMLETLGRIHLLAGAAAAAITVNQRVLELSAGNDELRAEALAGLVAAYRQTGELQAADDARRQALALLSTMQHPDPERIQARLRSAVATVPTGATETVC